LFRLERGRETVSRRNTEMPSIRRQIVGCRIKTSPHFQNTTLKIFSLDYLMKRVCTLVLSQDWIPFKKVTAAFDIK
jgi:hypothetical protein